MVKPTKLDNKAANAPIAQKVASAPIIPRALDEKLDKAAAKNGSAKKEASVINISVSDDVPINTKRKQSKVRLDSDEDESDDEPMVRSDDKEIPSAIQQPETLLKLSKHTSSKNTTSNGQDAAKTQAKRSRRSSTPSSDHPSTRATSDASSSDSDAPLADPSRNAKATEASASSDDEPLMNGSQRQATAKSVKIKKELSIDSDDDKPLKKRQKSSPKQPKISKVPAKDTAKVAKKIDGKPTKKVKREEEDNDEEEYRWWEQNEENDGSVKWKTLEHNGVLFPPPYERLPKDVKLQYGGRSLTLSKDAEEVAGFFGALIETEHAANPVFCKNFFEDFQKVCRDSGMSSADVPKDFKKCDFSVMFQYFESKKEEKKAIPKEEKKRLKEEKDALEEKYKEAVIDGRKEKIGNFRIEPPGLFRGRGAHPKTGRLKLRVMPEQITINIGENVPVPAPPEGHKWAEVKHDNTVTWLATWNENINNNVKYVMMAAGSSFKGQSDLKKYEKARRLKSCIKDIRKQYETELSDKVMETRQRATAMYFIDRFALRAGNEKGEDEADTVGCCSLRLEHISLKEPQDVIFDFLGKDSIRYYNEVTVDKRVFKNLRIFKKDKKDEDMIFDRLNTGKLNKHLTSLMPELSAKVFRTYNASFTFQEQLKQTDAKATVADKVLAYNRANREVAILCNHQRTVSKTHDTAMEKIEDKVKELKYQKMRLKRMMADLEPKLAKKKDLYGYESDIDDEWIVEHHAILYEREKERIRKKFERDNEKRLKEDEKAYPDSELKDRLAAAEDLKSMYAKEKKTGKVEAKSTLTVEKIEAQISKLDDRIQITKTQMIDKDENKTTALGTSKINYIDPRLTFAWCAKYSVPVEKMFTKTMREKFKWAAETPADWIF